MLNFASKYIPALVAMLLLVFSTTSLLSSNEVNATNIGTCYAGEFDQMETTCPVRLDLAYSLNALARAQMRIATEMAQSTTSARRKSRC